MQAQPEVVLASNHVSGIELVPQWRTSLGLLPAMRVCSALPDGADRRPIALWLLTQACRWARTWQASQGRAVTVSLPLLAEGLADPATLEAAVQTVRSAALAPGALDLLVSETTLLSSDARVHAAIALLRSLGVTFTLADFGAEVISLQRLARLLPDRVKIHRLFVRDVADHRERMALARSLIALAQTLKITAIADGISSDSDAQFFKWEGCDLGQGDGLVAACAPADVVDLLHHGRNRRH
jgi:EAL domain-containing protein (putative c-di-GMP-specific phosphodiesterase class I)